MLGFYTYGCFFAFARCLPETDVVQQFVDMVVKPLLAFPCAPYFDSLLGEPLYHKWRFIVTPADAVKHENQQDIELMQNGALFDFNDGVAGVGADLLAGDTLFGNLINDLPVRVGRGVLAAGQFLHGNVIVIHLAEGGNTVQTNYPFQLCSPFLMLSSDCMMSSTTADSAFSAKDTVTSQLTLGTLRNRVAGFCPGIRPAMGSGTALLRCLNPPRS